MDKLWFSNWITSARDQIDIIELFLNWYICICIVYVIVCSVESQFKHLTDRLTINSLVNQHWISRHQTVLPSSLPFQLMSESSALESNNLHGRALIYLLTYLYRGARMSSLSKLWKSYSVGSLNLSRPGFMLTPGGNWDFSRDVGLHRKVVGVEPGIGLKWDNDIKINTSSNAKVADLPDTDKHTFSWLQEC